MPCYLRINDVPCLIFTFKSIPSPCSDEVSCVWELNSGLVLFFLRCWIKDTVSRAAWWRVGAIISAYMALKRRKLALIEPNSPRCIISSSSISLVVLHNHNSVHWLFLDVQMLLCFMPMLQGRSSLAVIEVPKLLGPPDLSRDSSLMCLLNWVSWLWKS